MGKYLSNIPPASSELTDKKESNKLFLQTSGHNGDIKKTLLTELKNGAQYNINKHHIERVQLVSAPNSYVKTVDDTDAGNIPSSFINVLNKYNEESFTAYNTFHYYEDTNTKQTHHSYTETEVKKSIFNPYYGVKARGFTTNKPLLDDNVSHGGNPFKDTSDCSIWTLLQKSAEQNNNAGDLGHSIYRLADFMYCKDLGKVSNNHMITLRRFASPVGDNIFGASNTGDSEYVFTALPDIGRLVTWFGTDDNKLSDILKMSMYATWKNMESDIEEVDTNQHMSQTGIIGMVMNSLNPDYNTSQAAGETAGHDLMTVLGSKIGDGKVNWGAPGPYASHKAFTNYDNHKIYRPKNTVQSNHYYEGRLEFTHEFTLKFSYKLRSYGSINQKSAMLDLIHNILRVTYEKGTFWGGETKWIGPPGNDSAMKKANAFIDGAFEKLGGWTSAVASGGFNFQQLFGSLSEAANGALEKGKEIISKGAKEVATNAVQKTAQALSNLNTMDAVKGQLKNALGRPAMYAIQSLVKGEELGLWHVTIGNPLNPIAAFGNLILTNSELSFGDTPLGLDDFPTEVNVSVTLKHCKPRDMVEVGRMFAKGESGLALPLGQMPFSNHFTNGTPSTTDKTNYSEASWQQIFGTSVGDNISNTFHELTTG